MHLVRHICKAHKAETQKPTLQKSLSFGSFLRLGSGSCTEIINQGIGSDADEYHRQLKAGVK